MAKHRLRDLSPRQRGVLALASCVQFGLLIAAQVDISRRSPDEVRGSKLLWRLLSFVNFFGPLAYFRWGRRR